METYLFNPQEIKLSIRVRCALVMGTIDRPIDTSDSFRKKLSKQSTVLLCTTIHTIADGFINCR